MLKKIDQVTSHLTTIGNNCVSFCHEVQKENK